MRTPDFGRAAGDYTRHRRGFPASFFAHLYEHGLGTAGVRALDLGTGTGSIANRLAADGARVCGLDPSHGMLRAAGRAAKTGRVPAWIRARAEALPFASGAFELVTAGQCWHWFDGPRVAAECQRVLAPGGTLVVAHFDYLAQADNAAGLTEDLLLERNPGWTMAGSDGIYERWRPHLAGAGFAEVESSTWVEEVVYTQADWRGRIRACNGVLALGTPEAIAEYDATLRAALSDRYGTAPLDIPHRVFVLRAKPNPNRRRASVPCRRRS